MKKYAIALGGFDGLHIGHMAVIGSVIGRGLTPAVLLLEPLPRVHFFGENPKLLISESQRERLLTDLGVELLYANFEDIKDYSPLKFFEDILVDGFNAGALACGYNYRFGCEGRGSSDMLEAFCRERDIALSIAQPVYYGGEAVSSTRIRAALEGGDIVSANAMLGREFGYCLEVVHGDHIGGRLLGCPTINQLFPDKMVVPRYGVYESQTNINGVWLRSVTNIGRRPSFQSDEQRSETHIIGFDGDLYGKSIEVRLLKYKRGEMKFSSLDELKAQLERDRS